MWMRLQQITTGVIMMVLLVAGLTFAKAKWILTLQISASITSSATPDKY